MSPDYPNYYPSFDKCSWTIEVDRFYQISIESIDLNIGTEDTNDACFIKVQTSCNIGLIIFTLFMSVFILKEMELTVVHWGARCSSGGYMKACVHHVNMSV